MNKKIVLNSGKVYTLEDFYLSNLLKNDELLNELDMKTLPETFLNVFGVECLDSYKPILLKKIELYDQSQAVNSFIYKGTPYWLDKQQRACMKMVAESGLENIEIVFNNQTEILPAAFVKQFLTNLEVYAYQCYVMTAKHLQNASELWNPTDILNYDFTAGYPDKIVL
jgi:hypothetical protein